MARLERVFLGVPPVTRILRNGRTTIVFFKDGTKAVAKRPIDEPDDAYYGVCAAIAKRVAGSGTKLKKLVDTIEWVGMDGEKSKAKPSKNPKRFEHVEIGFGDGIGEIFRKMFEGKDSWK